MCTYFSRKICSVLENSFQYCSESLYIYVCVCVRREEGADILNDSSKREYTCPECKLAFWGLHIIQACFSPQVKRRLEHWSFLIKHLTMFVHYRQEQGLPLLAKRAHGEQKKENKQQTMAGCWPCLHWQDEIQQYK